MVLNTADAYEADYRRNLLKGELILALRAAKSWKADEPFAARPRAAIAFVASLLDDYDLTINMAQEVYRLDGQRDETLEMNAIFATLSSGKLNLEKDLHKINRLHSRLERAIEEGKDNCYHAMANLGLWYYRYGDRNLGKTLYAKSIEIAEKQHMLETAATAATFAAREAILAHDPLSATIFQQAKDLAKRSKSTVSEFYLRKLDVLALHTEKRAELLSPASAQRFLKDRRPAPAFRVEKDGKEVVLIAAKRK